MWGVQIVCITDEHERMNDSLLCKYENNTLLFNCACEIWLIRNHSANFTDWRVLFFTFQWQLPEYVSNRKKNFSPHVFDPSTDWQKSMGISEQLKLCHNESKNHHITNFIVSGKQSKKATYPFYHEIWPHANSSIHETDTECWHHIGCLCVWCWIIIIVLDTAWS